MAVCRTTDDFKDKLVRKITNAESGEQVRRYILSAVKSLRNHKINPHIVSRFINKTDFTLSELYRAGKGTRMAENIDSARAVMEEMKALIHEQRAS
jgi:hypothetical protein